MGRASNNRESKVTLDSKMTSVLVLQSFRDHGPTSWLARCRKSVQAWCEQQNYTYQFCGDELFHRVPAWYMEKVSGRLPIAADLARLQWIQAMLEQDIADVVAWLDADMFVFAPDELSIELSGSSVFGLERWLQKRDGKAGYRVHKNVHNAYCAFRKGSSMLPFLIDSILSMVARVDANYLAPQFVGPKLLTSLHNIVGFSVDERFGAISPDLKLAIEDQNVELVSRLGLAKPMQAANLCASLHAPEDARMHQFMDLLTNFKSGLT